MTVMPFALAASLFFSYGPSNPTVGDPVTIEYRVTEGERILPLEEEGYEIVSADGGTLVVRSFRPGPFTVQGTVERDGISQPFSGPRVDVRSVLVEGDALEPAPLKPPVELPVQRMPLLAIAGAAVAAIIAWAALFLLKGRSILPDAPVATREHLYIERLENLRTRPFDQAAVAEVAELVREYLASNDSGLARELTSRELLERARHSTATGIAAPLSEVLREGDLAKFSPWGSHFGAMGPLVDRAEAVVRVESEAAWTEVRRQ